MTTMLMCMVLWGEWISPLTPLEIAGTICLIVFAIAYDFLALSSKTH